MGYEGFWCREDKITQSVKFHEFSRLLHGVVTAFQFPARYHGRSAEFSRLHGGQRAQVAEDILAQKAKVTWERHSIAEIGRHRETSPGASVTASGMKLTRLREKGTSGRHDQEPASQHLASNRRDGDTGRQAGDGRHRETSGRHNPGASVTASGIQTQGDKQSRRHDPGASVTASGI